MGLAQLLAEKLEFLTPLFQDPQHLRNRHKPAVAMATAMAVAVIRPEHAYRGRPPRKSTFFMKNAVLGPFWSFLDLLDLKNGSGSKFYAGKWYRDVWRTKINPFRVKSMKLSN